MHRDYTPLFSAVAVLMPVLLLALFAGRDRLFLPKDPKDYSNFGSMYAMAGVLAGMIAEWASLDGLYEGPAAKGARSTAALCLYATSFVLALVFGVLMKAVMDTNPRLNRIEADAAAKLEAKRRARDEGAGEKP